MTDNITVFTHTSIRIRSKEKIIYIDPFKLKEEPHDADLIFITHDHYDHYSPEDIEKVCNPGTSIVVPEKMGSKVEKEGGYKGRIITVRPGTRDTIGGLEVEAVPAYNIMKAFHPKSAGFVGYILTIEGKRVYIAGDTDATKEAKAVRCDVALVPVGGTYTMDAVKAAELVNTIKPSVAIPTHYGNIVGTKADADIFAKNVKDPVCVEIKMEY